MRRSSQAGSPKLDILGLANPTAGVQVWKDSDSPSTASRRGEYFHHAVTAANGTYPVVTAKSLYGATETTTVGRSFVPPATETFGYDSDGNLTSDGRWTAYVWGTDLSGSMTGAGGVGGLLWVNNSQTTGGLPTGIQFVAYDGNGNVGGLIAASDGSNTARYEYGPFGEPLRATGALAGANPVRWSTKVTDDEGGLVYYGYRYYNPGTGRWLSRDPIGEQGGMKLYQAYHNNPLRYLDRNGLDNWSNPGGGQNGLPVLVIIYPPTRGTVLDTSVQFLKYLFDGPLNEVVYASGEPHPDGSGRRLVVSGG